MAKKPIGKRTSKGRSALSSSISAEMFGINNKKIDEQPEEAIKELSRHFAMIPIQQIERNPDQPRTEFDEEALQELSESIAIHGIIQPLTLRRLRPDQYQIISGERRFRAAKLADLKEVPAFIRIANDQELLEMALIENIQREDLNAMEVAYSYYRLKNEFNLTDESLSGRVGKKRATVTNYLRLLELHPSVQEFVKRGELSTGHAKAIAGVKDKELQRQFAEEVVRKGWNVRTTEERAKAYKPQSETKKKKPVPKPALSPDQERILRQFRASLGTGKIQMQIDDAEKGKGQITIRFENHEELTKLFESLE